MTNVGQYTPGKNSSTRFIIRNIAAGNKRIRVFGYPIGNGLERDLLAIPGISEADIRHSLVKGQLRAKLLASEIIVVDSNIDLLQFDDVHKLFLQQSGITLGLEVITLTDSQHETLRKLIHLADGVGGPMEGFASGSFRESLPLDDPFPTSIIWWESSSKVEKIIEKTLAYDASKRITSISWKVFDESGSLLATVTDTFAYNGSSPFESSRTRVINE